MKYLPQALSVPVWVLGALPCAPLDFFTCCLAWFFDNRFFRFRLGMRACLFWFLATASCGEFKVLVILKSFERKFFVSVTGTLTFELEVVTSGDSDVTWGLSKVTSRDLRVTLFVLRLTSGTLLLTCSLICIACSGGDLTSEVLSVTCCAWVEFSRDRTVTLFWPAISEH